ncbi:Chitotriosidase-1 [Morella rubra]|uniref:Chitotriosidase-1 n=1 Tax=Morella rubra TaxID=262757 RepID=A0A6A1UF30_9ROSI|nr:Chitotriosidase-1 [Morella rubra]
MPGRKWLSAFWAIFTFAGSIISLCNASPSLLASTNYSLESASPSTWNTTSHRRRPSRHPSPMPHPTHLPPGIKGGYWPSWLAEKHPPSIIPTSYFTHLFYAFVAPEATTYQLSITSRNDKWMRKFTHTLHAKTPRAKAFLSIVGGPVIFSNLASTQKSRAAFINSTIGVAREYGFDGLDLDWEFPNTPQDMSNLALLFKECRKAVQNESHSSGKPRLHVSAAVYFAPKFLLSNVSRTYPGKAIKKYVDFVSPMCYNYHGSWDTSATSSHALLYDPASNISTSHGISSWIKVGVPPRKLVMGLPLFGRTWKLKSPSAHVIGAPAVGTGTGHRGVMSYSAIVDYNVANSANVAYDPHTVSTYSYVGDNWIGYDGPRSIQEKVKFARARGLGGYFFWALGYDKKWSLSAAASSAWDKKSKS